MSIYLSKQRLIKHKNVSISLGFWGRSPVAGEYFFPTKGQKSTLSPAAERREKIRFGKICSGVCHNCIVVFFASRRFNKT